MDSLTAWIVGGGAAVVIGGISGACAAIFNRQEKRIALLEQRVETLTQQLIDCTAKHAATEAELESIKEQLKVR